MLKQILLLLSFSLLFVIPAHADTNGVWVDAEDIRAGSFGSDETQNNFSFTKLAIGTTPNDNFTVTINGNVSTDKICLSGECLDSWIKNIWQKQGDDIFYNGGNVGIGTSNPSSKLDVVEDVSSYYYAGNFENSIRSSSAKLAGSYGVYASAPSGGGYFRDSNSYGSTTYVSRGDYSILGYGKIRGDELCIGYNNCIDGFQAVKEANTRTGNLGWETVYNEQPSCSGNCIEYGSFRTERPVLGVRMSGGSNRGSVCVAQFSGYFAGGVTKNAILNYDSETNYGLELDYGWSAYGRDTTRGSMMTKEFLIDELDAGIWSYQPSTGWNNDGASIVKGYSSVNNKPSWTYNKPLGLTYIPAETFVRVTHWKYKGNTPRCKIEVLYGEYK